LSSVITATAPCNWYPTGLMPRLRYHRVARLTTCTRRDARYGT